MYGNNDSLDVLKNIATPDLAQKKLVYLYLMNYARAYPDLCILAVNTFVQDSEDGNPLVRALAIRTMGCIRVDKMIDYLPEPLRRTLKDESPYVRKTAAICVAKLYDLNPELCVENGFVTILQDLLNDSNATVVANAVSALAEIQESSPELEALAITSTTLTKLLVALNECSEWGRIAILNSLATFDANATEAEQICERVSPQFQHANASVVMAAVRVIMHNIPKVKTEMAVTLKRKMAPSLVTLISSPPELQYVALRNISLLLQKNAEVLSNEMRVFFCKYNDPPYVKNEKLNIMIMLANENNMDQLLMELKEYASEIDVDFVRRAVRAIGRCAIQIDEASERCVNVLLELINTKVTYVVQEAIVVIRDIFRKYPSRYEGIIPTLCSNLEELDDPAARASLIWIIGEYAEKINNAAELLSTFMEGFKDEYTQVQLQLLTAVVKLFLKKPKTTQDLVQQILQTATHTDNSDIRDRAFIYWRLLSSDPQIAKSIVLATNKPPIDVNTGNLRPALRDELIAELSSIASVYHKPAATFIAGGKTGGLDSIQKKAIEEQRADAKENPVTSQQHVENLLDIDFGGDGGGGGGGGGVPPSSIVQPEDVEIPAAIQSGGNAMDDLFDLFGTQASLAESASSTQGTAATATTATKRYNTAQDDMLDLI